MVEKGLVLKLADSSANKLLFYATFGALGALFGGIADFFILKIPFGGILNFLRPIIQGICFIPIGVMIGLSLGQNLPNLSRNRHIYLCGLYTFLYGTFSYFSVEGILGLVILIIGLADVVRRLSQSIGRAITAFGLELVVTGILFLLLMFGGDDYFMIPYSVFDPIRTMNLNLISVLWLALYFYFINFFMLMTLCSFKKN